MEQSKNAVIIRGQARTWPYIAKNNIETFNKFLDNPDWYVVMSKTTTVSEEDVRQAFVGSNLISLEFVDDDDYALYTDVNSGIYWKRYPTAYWRQAWFEYLGNLAKRKHELATGIKYKHIVCARPDTWFFYEDHVRRTTLDLTPYSLIGTYPNMYNGDFVGSDFTWISGSIAHSVMSMRYLDTYYTDTLLDQQLTHAGDLQLLQYYLARNFIHLDPKKHMLSQIMVRPNMIPILPLTVPQAGATNFFNSEVVGWHDMTVQQQVDMCREYKIDPQDYFLLDDHFTKKT
jgi:hypothetical protein